MLLPRYVVHKHKTSAWSVFCCMWITVAAWIAWSIWKLFREPEPIVSTKHIEWGNLPDFWICPERLPALGGPLEVVPTNFKGYYTKFPRKSPGTSWSSDDIYATTAMWNASVYAKFGSSGLPEFNGSKCAYYQTSVLNFDMNLKSPLIFLFRAEFRFPNVSIAQQVCKKPVSASHAAKKHVDPPPPSTSGKFQSSRQTATTSPKNDGSSDSRRMQSKVSPTRAQGADPNGVCYFGVTLVADSPPDAAKGFEPWVGEITHRAYWGYFPPIVDMISLALSKKVIGKDTWFSRTKHPEYEGKQRGIVDIDPRVPKEYTSSIMFSVHIAAQPVEWDISQARITQVFAELSSVGGYITVIVTLFGFCFVRKKARTFRLTRCCSTEQKLDFCCRWPFAAHASSAEEDDGDDGEPRKNSAESLRTESCTSSEEDDDGDDGEDQCCRLLSHLCRCCCSTKTNGDDRAPCLGGNRQRTFNTHSDGDALMDHQDAEDAGVY